jgi:hypothetical protein
MLARALRESQIGTKRGEFPGETPKSFSGTVTRQ